MEEIVFVAAGQGQDFGFDGHRGLGVVFYSRSQAAAGEFGGGEVNYFSMFSGIGGFDLALNRQGHKCIGYSEIDKYAIQTYKKNFGEKVKNYGDARKIRTNELPDFDLLCAGFPCQAFSIAGKRRGFEDTRGTLFFEIARILKAKRPPNFLLENVKGLLSHQGGDTFDIILSTLDELGYDTQWMVLNSKFFGVPQNRERVFIIGNLRGQPGPEILPFRENDKKNSKVRTAVKTLTGGGHSGCLHSQMTGIAHCLDSNYYKGYYDLKKSNRTVIFDGQHKKLRRYEGFSPTLCQKMGTGGNNVPITHSLYPRSSKTGKGGTGHLTKQDGMAYCLDAGNNQAIEIDRLRRLTPVECERLQGFPDNWTAGVSDTQRYRQLGNAVTVNVIEAIMGKSI